MFSFASKFAGFLNIYNQLYSTEEFQDFHDHINEGTPSEIIVNFIRNGIFKQVDPIIASYLENPELTQIMANKNVNHEDKCKIVGGKIANYILDHHPFFDNRRSETGSETGSESEPMFGFITDKREIIKGTLESMGQMSNLDQVETVNDVYTLVINDMTKDVAKLVESLVGPALVFTMLSDEAYLQNLLMLLGKFNENYEYQSDFCNDDLIDHDHDDDNNDDSSDSDDGDDAPVPENKKRSREKMLDGNEDSEKPANKKNKK